MPRAIRFHLDEDTDQAIAEYTDVYALRRPRLDSGELHLQPRPGIAPHPVGRRGRDAHCRSRFVAGESGEVA
jgi:hypothetical protein